MKKTLSSVRAAEKHYRYIYYTSPAVIQYSPRNYYYDIYGGVYMSKYEKFVRDRITQLRLRKGISEYQIKL